MKGIFNEIIPISAMKNDGVDIYIETLKKYLKPGPMYYPEDMITDKNEIFYMLSSSLFNLCL